MTETKKQVVPVNSANSGIKIIANILVIIFVAIALVIDGFYVYYHYFNEDVTIGTNYITTIETKDMIKSDDLSEREKMEYEERYFVVFNVLDNSKNNGIELQEMQLNYSSDYKLNSSYATGMQLTGKYNPSWRLASEINKMGFAYVNAFFNFYNTFDRISWKSTDILDRDKVLIISIDGEPYSIQMTGKKKMNFLVSLDYNYVSLFDGILNAISSNSAGYGDWYFKMDLSKFFTIKKLDKNTGQFINDDVTDIINNYVVVKVHYESNGAAVSKQSIFGVIDNNPNFDLHNTYDTEFSQGRFVYSLTAKDFLFNYYESREGHFLSLKLAKISAFKNMPRSKIVVKLDLNDDYLIDREITLIGLDYNAFENLEIDTIEIIGNGNFTFLSKSLHNSKLQTLKRSAGINLIFEAGAINNTFTEVVL